MKREKAATRAGASATRATPVDPVPTGAFTYAGKEVQDANSDTSWTTMDRGWAMSSFWRVRRAETLSCTWSREANGGTAVARPASTRRRELMRKHGDLFLGGEDDFDLCPPGLLEQVIEPGHGSPAEGGDRQECPNMTGETGEAHGVRHGDRDMVSHAVQLGRHLPGRQAGPFGEENSHGVSVSHIYMTDTNVFPVCLGRCGLHSRSKCVI